jgi:hypothetical protein
MNRPVAADLGRVPRIGGSFHQNAATSPAGRPSPRNDKAPQKDHQKCGHPPKSNEIKANQPYLPETLHSRLITICGLWENGYGHRFSVYK